MDTKMVARGIADGISSIPGLMGRGLVRTWQGSGAAGDGLRDRNQRETERFIRLVKSLGDKEEPLRRLIELVMVEFYQKMNDSGRAAINSKINYGVGHFAGKTAAQFALAYTAGSIMLRHVTSAPVYREFVRFGVSVPLNVLMWQGLIEEAAEASRRLRRDYPQTYYKVSIQDLDMIYFLVEGQLEPYIKFINSHPAMCRTIENELCKILPGKVRQVCGG